MPGLAAQSSDAILLRKRRYRLSGSAGMHTYSLFIKKKGALMLVLRRKVGESIILAGSIQVSVLAVEGERVKIGLSAPPDVTIVREELLHLAERQAAPDPPVPQR